MGRCLTRTVDKRRLELRSASGRFPKLDALLQGPRQRLDVASGRFAGALGKMISRKRTAFESRAGRLQIGALRRDTSRKRIEAERLAARMKPAMIRRLDVLRRSLTAQGRVLDTLSYQGVLARGFALVTKPDGALVRSVKSVSEGDALRLRFADGEVAAQAGTSTPSPPLSSPDTQRPRIRKRSSPKDQGDLF
jgi:exodeoxyribonuclease VII large subunit